MRITTPSFRPPIRFFSILLALTGLACAEQVPPPQIDLLIRDVTVVSAERPEPLADAWVAVAGQRIVALGQGEPDPYRAAVEIDGSGRFLTPGLIDSHVHLAAIPGFNGFPGDAPEHLKPAFEAYEKQLPRSYLFFGFTTVIDLNVIDAGFLERFVAAPMKPDLYHCGGALALANGYPMSFLPEEVRFDSHPNFLWDERQADDIPDRFNPEDHTPAAVVARVAASGGICTKTHWEDGFGPQKIWPTPTRELIEAVIEESHRHGMTATLHANSYESHRFATDAGVDVIVHGLWNWDGLRVQTGVPAEIAELLEDQRQRGIGVMPTSRVLTGLRDLFDPDFLEDPRLADAVPAELIAWYRTEEAQGFTEELRADFGGGDDETIFRRMGGGIEGARRVVSHLAEIDAKILFGSDTPSSPTYANPPGLNGTLEIELLSDAGLTPRKILEAATLANARAFHLEDEVGTIEVGKLANLLLLRADPLESADAWSDIDTVIIGGRPVERSELSARLATPD